jgi:hypothetical protein
VTSPVLPGSVAWFAQLASLPALAAALAKVQANLPKLERDRTVTVQQKNGETYSYSYTTLANLSETVLPLLAANGLSWVCLPGAGSDGKMCVRYLLLHESGEMLPGEFPISGEGGIQIIGGRITYARRYCLAAVTGATADEDDEARLAEYGRPASAQRAAPRARQAARGQRPATQDGPTAQRAQRGAEGPALPDEELGQMSDAQRAKMNALFRKAEVGDRAQRLGYVNEVLADKVAADRRVESSTELTSAEAGHVIDALQAWVEQLEAP